MRSIILLRWEMRIAAIYFNSITTNQQAEVVFGLDGIYSLFSRKNSPTLPILWKYIIQRVIFLSDFSISR
jgi:hypothetical protein